MDSQADAGAKQRMFTYKATIPKDKLSYQVKELKIKLYDVEHPDGIEEIFYVKGVEIEKPVLNEFKVNFSEGPSDLKELTINKSDTGTFSISAGGEYKVSITNIDFSDNLYIGAVVLKIFDNDRNTEKTLKTCLLYTSDAADDLLCVDLGGRRIIKKKKITSTNQHDTHA